MGPNSRMKLITYIRGWEAPAESEYTMDIAELLPPTLRGMPHSRRSQYSQGLGQSQSPQSCVLGTHTASKSDGSKSEDGSGGKYVLRRILSSSGISYLDKIIIIAYELSV